MAVERDESIEAKARYLLTTNEYNPYSPDNFSEAMAQIGYADMKAIAACIAEAVKSDLEVQLLNYLALRDIRRAVEQYWLDVARRVVEKEMRNDY